MRNRVPLLALAVSCCLLAPSARAQKAEPRAENIHFFTADHVELSGTFYPAGPKAPAVLLLHKVGGSRNDAGWPSFARELHKNGFAVLSFDFRGHGASTTVHEGFWQVPAHKTLRGAHPTRDSLSFRDFTAPYHYASLVNDIAAARRALELKDEEDLCDSSNLVVIGEGTGATLGMLWVAAEWQRWRAGLDPAGRPVRQGLEGQDIACAVWLSIDPALDGKRAVPVASWSDAEVRKRLPLGFLYGGGDTRSAGLTRAVLEGLQQAGRDELNPLTVSEAIEGTDAAGIALLGTQGREAEKKILTYLKTVFRGRSTPVRPRPDPRQAPALIPLERFGFR
jgi:pimeloyl-ACP methyl ester carboxylesterase